MFTYERYRDRKAKGYVTLLSKTQVNFCFLDPLMGDVEETHTETVLLEEIEDIRKGVLRQLADIDALIVDMKALESEKTS